MIAIKTNVGVADDKDHTIMLHQPEFWQTLLKNYCLWCVHVHI